MADWRIEQLTSHHDRSGFTCGKALLDQFLRQLASQHAAKDFSRTYVAVLPPDVRVLGYYALLAGAFDLSVLPEAQRRKLPRHPAPVVHLGRLAVDQGAQRQGLGALLLMDALARCEGLADQLGIYAVEVWAIDEQARAFYAKYGFEPLLDAPDHLYLTMKTVRKLSLGQPGTGGA